MTLHLHGLGHFHPENQITNGFLEGLDIGTSDAWIVERVGIRTRRTVLPLDYIRETRNHDARAAREASLHTDAEMGARAAEMAISRAGVAREDIGLVVAGSSAPDTVSPAEACNIACALGLEVLAFDVHSACTSFLAILYMLAIARREELPRFVLVVAVEGMTRTADYSDRSTAVLFGDAAVAAVVSTRAPGRAEIVGTHLDSSPAGSGKVTIPRAGHFQQEGRTVQTFAIHKTVRGFERLWNDFHAGERAFHFVGHQANLRMLESVCRQCEIPPERHHSNVERFGNTAAAGAPSVISMAWDQWQGGDDVAVVGVGAGLTWGSTLVRFNSGGGRA
ncbi:MAG TPA: ketoacyl-ACP synthase III [Candidatus Binatia bacterium]|nr:ketoacyl-ACP synthase III [Candidatus Binatia bacterium]